MNPIFSPTYTAEELRAMAAKQRARRFWTGLGITAALALTAATLAPRLPTAEPERATLTNMPTPGE